MNSAYRELFYKQFKDPYDFIDKVIDTCDKVFEIYDGATLASAMCVFNISIGSHNGGYIYGAVTDEKYRGKGYFSKLINMAKKHYISKGYDFLITIPADEGLFKMYKHLEFDRVLGGVISAFGENGKIIAPERICFKPFDGNFDYLYSLHKKYDVIIKEKNFFKICMSDFEIRYANEGYAVFKDEDLIYLACDGMKYEEIPKGIMMILNKFDMPDKMLCDMLLEI